MNRPTTSAIGPVSLGDLAAALDLELRGDPEVRVDAGATLAAATPGQISFLANPAYRSLLISTRASAVVLSASAADDCPCAALVSESPYAAWARVLILGCREDRKSIWALGCCNSIKVEC